MSNKYANEIKTMNRHKKAADHIAKILGYDWYANVLGENWNVLE